MPDVCRLNILITIYKDKGVHMNCCNYRGLKLLGHAKRLCECVVIHRLRDTVSFSDGQLGFMPGVGTTDAIFDIRTVHEKNTQRAIGP